MAIITNNGTSDPMPLFGCLITAELDNGYYTDSGKKGSIVDLFKSPQIIGLVPIFPCVSDECRIYKADELNDLDFMLPVFAETNPVLPYDNYFNDINSWFFDFPTATTPGSTHVFYLDKYIGTSWVQQAVLNNDIYGTYYGIGALCDNLNWIGYKLEWQKVLSLKGEGIYRFRIQTSEFGVPDFDTCGASPPFCLKEFNCNLADRTTKWEAYYNGGKFGNIDKSHAGSFWQLCCVETEIDSTSGAVIILSSNPIQWYDSIRMEGFFGSENTDTERKSIKYTTGLVNKIRDEVILKFSWRSGSLPFWIHERFKAYGLLADQLLVSDYNVNNPNYNIKRFPVIADSSYNPDYKGWSRNSKVKVEFKAQVQNIVRTRCC